MACKYMVNLLCGGRWFTIAGRNALQAIFCSHNIGERKLQGTYKNADL